MRPDSSQQTPRGSHPIAIVTGAAGGIGSAFARELAELGYSLILWDKDPQALSAFSATLPVNQVASEVVASVADAGAWDDLATRLREGSSPVCLLVNNAGVLTAGRLADASPQDLQRLVEINLLGTMNGCRAMAPLLAGNTQASAPLPVGVLNVASIFASLTPPGFAAYNASKAAVVALTETLQGEWRPLGLSTTAILPGITRTRLFASGSYTNESLAAAVVERGGSGSLTPETVAKQALQAYARGKLVAPIGSRARLRHWLSQWIPGFVRQAVAREANRTLDEIEQPAD